MKKIDIAIDRPKVEHFYQDIVGWFDFHFLYSLAVEEAKDGASFLEIGTANGKSAAYMAVEIVNSGKKIDFESIDISLKVDVTHLFIEKLKGITPIPWFYEMSSAELLEAAKEHNKKFDFIFFDGAHDYETVKAELEGFYPLLKEGGIMGGHDFLNVGMEGERKAVVEFFESEPDLELKINYISWWTQKPVK